MKIVLRRFETPQDIVSRVAAQQQAAKQQHQLGKDIERKTCPNHHRFRRFGKRNFASPTEASERNRWRRSHPQRLQNRQVRRHRRGGKKYVSLPTLHSMLGKNMCKSKSQKWNGADVGLKDGKKKRFGGRPKTKGETSGEFYHKRRLMRNAMEEERKLSLLSERRIRMEKKLEETVSAFRFMMTAYGKSVQVLHDGAETQNSGQRIYPKLLAQMERNRLRTKNLMMRMTSALEQARSEENAFVNTCAQRRRYLNRLD